MKKKILTILSILMLSLAANANTDNTSIMDIIRLYKAGNYSECYLELENFIKNEPDNALANYYMGMTSAQVGKRNDAISYYEKVLLLETSNNNLYRYAQKGKRCLESPDKCEENLFGSMEDEFIQNKKSPKYTEQVRGELERLKIENFMREMNRNDSIDASQFREYKDFSNVPTNDEIVAALRTLQRARLGNVLNNNIADISYLTNDRQQNTMLNLLGSSSMNPQFIQAMLLNNSMTQGF